jgi:hypothetical protein
MNTGPIADLNILQKIIIKSALFLEILLSYYNKI